MQHRHKRHPSSNKSRAARIYTRSVLVAEAESEKAAAEEVKTEA